MNAMVLPEVGAPLELRELPVPEPGRGELRVRVSTCGVCRTDLHVACGDLPVPKLPLVLGHQIVGTVDAVGPAVERLRAGDRVGVPWLARTCRRCRLCRSGRENLCERARFTGYTVDGGFAQYAVCDEQFAFPLDPGCPAALAAPLLCAGLIGYRALRMTADAQRLGLFGFGSAAHILAQVARFQKREVYAFTRPGDREGQRFARTLGAVWAGGSDEAPPVPLDAAIVFAPDGTLVPVALRATGRGGVVVCAGIHMSDIPRFPYRILWEERQLRSVANLTRRDGEELLALAPEIPITTTVHRYPLEDAGRALDDLRAGRFRGSAVLEVGDPAEPRRRGGE